jgi:hypothetical protein
VLLAQQGCSQEIDIQNFCASLERGRAQLVIRRFVYLPLATLPDLFYSSEVRLVIACYVAVALSVLIKNLGLFEGPRFLDT